MNVIVKDNNDKDDNRTYSSDNNTGRHRSKREGDITQMYNVISHNYNIHNGNV